MADYRVTVGDGGADDRCRSRRPTAIVFILDHLALTAAIEGDAERAIRLVAASRVMRAKSGTNVRDVALDEKELAPYLETVSDEAAAAALADGQAMDLQRAVAYALEGAGSGQAAPTIP